MAFTVTHTARAIRIHRDSCKRAAGAASTLHAPAGVVAYGQAASCCKPNPVDVDASVLEARKAEALGAESIAIYRQAVAEAKEQAAEAPATEQAEEQAPEAPATEQPTATVQFSGRGIGLSVWRTLGVHGAAIAAANYGVEYSADKATRTITFTGEAAQAAATELGATWDAIWAEWAAHRAAEREAYAAALAEGRTAARKYRRIWIDQQLEVHEDINSAS